MVRVRSWPKFKAGINTWVWRGQRAAGTGIHRPTGTRRSLSNLLSQFKLTIGADPDQSRNVAMVMVTASLPHLLGRRLTLDVCM